jgi:hypothetical protein
MVVLSPTLPVAPPRPHCLTSSSRGRREHPDLENLLVAATHSEHAEAPALREEVLLRSGPP